METIRKVISLEKARSRNLGVLPFYEYNGDNTMILSGVNSNFGQFVCDLSGYSFTCETLSGETTWSGNTDNVIRTKNVMRRYNILLEMLKNSIHLFHIKNISCENTNEYENKFVAEFDYSGTTYDFIREAKPLKKIDFEYNSQTNSYTFIGENEEDIEDVDYVILISEEDFDLYNQYLGVEFVKLVDELYLSGECTFTEDKLTVPYVSIPILFTNEIADIGTMTNYLDETYDEVEFSKDLEQFSSLTATYNIESWKLQPSEMNVDSSNTINIESRLQTLRLPKYFTDDEGTILEGIFQDFPNATGDSKGKFFKCIYYDKPSKVDGVYHYSAVTRNRVISSYTQTEEEKPYPINGNIYYQVGPSEVPSATTTYNGTGVTENNVVYSSFTRTIHCEHYRWWEVIPYDSLDLICADDESVPPNVQKYRTLTVFEVLKKMIPELQASDEDFYYFLVKYDNRNNCSMIIPYKVGEVFNKDNKDSAYTGDYIISSSITQYSGLTSSDTKNIITFKYNIGATYSNSGYTTVSKDGTICEESYIIEFGNNGKMNIDNYEDVDYWYDDILYDKELVDIYSDDLNLERKTNITNVESMRIGDVWKTDGSVLNTQMIQQDYLVGTAFDYNTDINVEINRGNAAAFESHFRLSECNTFQDLEDMKNGTFFGL